MLCVYLKNLCLYFKRVAAEKVNFYSIKRKKMKILIVWAILNMLV